MCTPVTHAVVAIGLGKAFTARKMPLRFWLILMWLSACPDADVLAFNFGIPYGAFFGHRGFSHSLLFAFLVGLAVSAVTYRKLVFRFWPLANLYFLVIASHGFLDSFTNGGLGIAFFSPFDNQRYFFPWTPIEVPDIGLHFFSSGRGWATLSSEICIVWLPALVFISAIMGVRRLNTNRMRRNEKGPKPVQE